MGVTLQYQATIETTASSRADAALQYIGNLPERLVTAAAYWAAAVGPIHQMLDDPEAEFELVSNELQKICIANDIAHRPASPTGPAAFPVWLFREAYGPNP